MPGNSTIAAQRHRILVATRALVALVLAVAIGVSPDTPASAAGLGYAHDEPGGVSYPGAVQLLSGTTPASTLSLATTSGEVLISALGSGASAAPAAVVAAEAGGGLARSVGSDVGSGLPMTRAAVDDVADRAGVGLEGVDVRIVSDPFLE